MSVICEVEGGKWIEEGEEHPRTRPQVREKVGHGAGKKKVAEEKRRRKKEEEGGDHDLGRRTRVAVEEVERAS